MTTQFLLTCLLVVVSPGTGVLFTISAGLSQGKKASQVAAFGCTLGIIPHLLAAIFGVAALLHASALAFQTLKYAGVVYLLYMAWMTLRDKSAFQPDETPRQDKAAAIISRSILINLLNPKLSIFFLAFLPQFIENNDSQPILHMLELSGVFMVMSQVVFSIYGWFAASVRGTIHRRPVVLAWMRRGFASAFALLGVRLALTD
ncbi:MAG TPA: LysE family translocator [Candidatus Sulfotelmatobacter sp.]|nr:LysE family translocator [Candidatus Sulfotelmatobacter sp.]